MSNTSATGGYILPAPPGSVGNLSLQDFIQTVLVGVSALPGEMVRAKWQLNPPKQPDICVDWLSFGITEDDSDTFAYDTIQPDNSYILQRMEALTVQCTFAGPNALEYAKLVRDNFQIGPNREALQSVGMDFVSTSRITRVPDLVNERWRDRWEMSVYLRREILRTYPVLYFVSAAGTLYALASPPATEIPINVTEGT